MLGVIGIIIISIAIFVLTYIKSEENRFTKAIVCSGLITVLCFVGPYIVDAMSNWGEGKTEEPGNLCEIEENKEEHMHKTASEEKENVIEATCLDSGQYEEVSYCECGEALERKIITIDALGHNYIKMITNPSCNERGFTTYKCSRCQDSYVDNYVEAIAHDFADGICLRCGLVTPEYEEFDYGKFNVEGWCTWLSVERYRGKAFQKNRKLLRDKFRQAMDAGAGEDVRRIYYKYLE